MSQEDYETWCRIRGLDPALDASGNKYVEYLKAPTYAIPIPYQANPMTSVDLVLDSSSYGVGLEESMTGLCRNHPRLGEEEYELIMRSAVLLFHAKAGTFGECLDTALVWYFG